MVPELTRLRDKALHSLKFAVAGLNEEMSALDDPDIDVVDEGLMVHVPFGQGRGCRGNQQGRQRGLHRVRSAARLAVRMCSCAAPQCQVPVWTPRGRERFTFDAA
ncbi:hypothetical protein [Streptomyces sp. NPDC006285]|uniref:hypothetical protein n=1 Tax=Streptomyces sp. NPDC006285 TaxID=3364742 RepID=UPI0036736D02